MANYELGNLVWKVTGETGDFDKSITKSQGGLDRLAQRATATGARLTRNVTVPLAAVGTALIAATIETGRYADKLLDLEEITGLSTDTLQELEQVASDAGVNFEGLTGTIQKFSSRLPGIENGTSEGAKAFERLGVELRGADGSIRDMEELFPELIKSLQGVENTTDRNAIAQQVFGRSLQDLAPVLGMTADEFDEARQKANDLGLVLGRDALEAANDYRIATADLGRQVKGLWREFAVDLIPILQDTLVPLLGNLIDRVRDVTGWFIDLDDGTKKIIGAMAVLAAGAGPVIGAIGALAKMKAAIIALNTTAMFGPVGIIAAVAGLSAGLYLLGRRMIQTTRETRDFAEIAQDIGDAQLDRALDALNKELETGSDQWVKNYTEADRWAAATRDLLNDYGNLEDTMAGTLTTAQRKRLSDALATKDADVLRAVLEDLIVARGGETEASIAAAEAAEREAAAREIAAAQAEAQREMANRAAAEARDEAEKLYRSLLDQRDVESEIERIEVQRAAALSDLADNYVRTGEAVDLLNEYYDELVAQEQALIDVRKKAEQAAKLEEKLREAQAAADEQVRIEKRRAALVLELFGTEREQFKARLAEQLALYKAYGLSKEQLDEYALSQWQEFNDSQVTDSEEKNKELIEDDEETQMTQLEMYQQYQDARLEIAEDGIEQEKDATEAFLEWYEDKYIGRVLSAASGLYSALASFASARADAEIAAIERSADSEEEKARKIREIKIRQARADKAAGIFKATIDTANAIVGFLAEPGGVAGIVLSVLAGVAGAAQVGAIAAQPIPAFAMGGDFITNGPQQIMVGDNPGGRERVTVEPLGGDGGGKPMRILVMLDGRQIAGSTVDYINNGVVRVEARA